ASRLRDSRGGLRGDGYRRRSRWRPCWRRRDVSQPKPASPDFFPRLLVESVPLRAALGRRARVRGQDLSHLAVDRLLQLRLVAEDTTDVAAKNVGRLDPATRPRTQPFL